MAGLLTEPTALFHLDKNSGDTKIHQLRNLLSLLAAVCSTNWAGVQQSGSGFLSPIANSHDFPRIETETTSENVLKSCINGTQFPTCIDLKRIIINQSSLCALKP